MPGGQVSAYVACCDSLPLEGCCSIVEEVEQ